VKRPEGICRQAKGGYAPATPKPIYVEQSRYAAANKPHTSVNTNLASVHQSRYPSNRYVETTRSIRQSKE
jgi:hypothetical protein